MEHVKKMYNETLSRMKDLYRDAINCSGSEIDLYAGKAEAMEQAMDLMKYMLGPAIEAMMAKQEPVMTFKNVLDAYCNWNDYITVNYDGKTPVAVGKTLYIMENRQDLFGEIVDTFDFYDDTMSVRLKPTDAMLEKLFKEFQNLCFVESKDSGDVLADDWYIWNIGTGKTEILEWFNQYHSKGLEWLLNNFSGYTRIFCGKSLGDACTALDIANINYDIDVCDRIMSDNMHDVVAVLEKEGIDFDYI